MAATWDTASTRWDESVEAWDGGVPSTGPPPGNVDAAATLTRTRTLSATPEVTGSSSGGTWSASVTVVLSAPTWTVAGTVYVEKPDGTWVPADSMKTWTGSVWKTAYPATGQTSVVIASATGAGCGATLTVSGTITAFAAGPPASGTVTVYSDLFDGVWTSHGSASVTTGGAWTRSVTGWPHCSDARIRVSYSGSGSYLASENIRVVPGSGLVGGAITGGAITNTTMAFTWVASPGATQYGVYRDGVRLTAVGSPSYSASGLTPGTFYDWAIRPETVSLNGTMSPTRTGRTSASEVRDTGSSGTLSLPPQETSTWQSVYGWGYYGDKVAQAALDTQTTVGVIDYGGASVVRPYLAASMGGGTLGLTRLDNATVSGQVVRLYRMAGVGAASAVGPIWRWSSSAANVGVPTVEGTANAGTALVPGSGGDVTLSATHATVIAKGTARSLLMVSSSLVDRALFAGETDQGWTPQSCWLKMNLSWDYVSQAAVVGAWV